MSEQRSGGDAAGTAREIREHEREARERDPDERDPATGVPADEHVADDIDPAAEPAPPGNVGSGEVSGGS